jgi:hypothetical protein
MASIEVTCPLLCIYALDFTNKVNSAVLTGSCCKVPRLSYAGIYLPFICIVPHLTTLHSMKAGHNFTWEPIATFFKYLKSFLEAFVSWEPNCDPGRFEMVLDAMKLQDLVIAACSLWIKVIITHLISSLRYFVH